jgi:uncharacterized iron-regulated protein
MNKIKNRSYFFKCFFTIAMLYVLPNAAQLSENNYKIYSVKSQKEVTLKEIAIEMKNYDVLFFGEEHNDSVTHFLQHQLLELLHQNFGTRIALSMEMFDRDVQPVMNEYLVDAIKEKHFKKDARVWNNYRDYKPMVEFAKKNKLHVICANAASRYTNLAGRQGQKALKELPKASRVNFAPLPYDTATGAYYNKLMGLSHAPASTDTSVKKMPAMMGMGNFNLVMAQSLWDATMAYSIAEYLKKNKGQKVMQVNGRFHSDEGFAIVTRLKKYQPKAKALIISSTSDDKFPNIDWLQYKHLGDFMIITDPSVPKTYDN